MTVYTTIGSVRGSCGHRHRSADAAYDCLHRDQRGCRSQGGYSDRQVSVLVGDAWVLYDQADERLFDEGADE